MRKIIPIRFLLVLSSFLLTVLLYVDRACISVAKEDISTDLGFDIKQFGWVMAVFTLGYALFQTPSGKWADKKGPRGVIASIVAIWSVLTAVTGIAWNYTSMIVIRFLFGAGEAGAFPALSKVVYNWFPLQERGIVQGINFSGSRLGAAFGIPMVAVLIEAVGWRHSFLIFGGIGVLFSLVWFLLFRDKPEESSTITQKEKDYIIKNRQQPSKVKAAAIPFGKLIQSKIMRKTMLQYICSNFTFYFTLTWMFPFIKEKFEMSTIEASMYASVPLIAGFFGNIFSGALVDAIYRKGNFARSRRLPAIIGFALAAFGMIMVTMSSSAFMSVAFLAIAVFGADMTLSPSWAFCIDVGKENAGSVSGTMNMAGNLGAFVTIIAYPYLFSWTGSNLPFFYIAAALSAVAIYVWSTMDPSKELQSDF